MNKHHACALVVALVFAGGAFAAEEAKAPEMTPEQKAMVEAWEAAGKVGPQHEQLKVFVGKWKAKASMWQDPSAPPSVSDGAASTAVVADGRFIRMDYEGTWQGQTFQGFAYTGYDNVRKKFVSTWADSMSTAFFMAMGDYDAASKTYTYKGEIADPTQAGKPLPIRQTLKVIDGDHHTFESFETRGGKEVRSMLIEYTRQ